MKNWSFLAITFTTACSSVSTAGMPEVRKVFPIEYRAAEGEYPKAIIGFFHNQFYQSYENRERGDRLNSESRGKFEIRYEDGAYLTDFVPIFAPSKQRMEFKEKGYTCKAIDQGESFLIDCFVVRTSRHFQSVYEPGKGIMWFQGVCYPDFNRTCKYEPVDDGMLLFSPRMITSFR